MMAREKALPVSKADVVAEALKLLKREGLEGITFRKLIARLHIKAPAIYWRFESKRDLLEAVAETILQRHFADLAPKPSGRAWQSWLKHILNRLRDALLAYPDGARLIAGARPHQTPTLTRIAEYSLSALEESVGLATAGAIVFTALHYTFGHVIEEQSSPSLEELAGPSAAPIVAGFPTIARLIAMSGKKGNPARATYNLGLDLIIHGGEAITLVSRRQFGTTPNTRTAKKGQNAQ